MMLIAAILLSVKTYLFKYRHDGSDYVLPLPADSKDEACERVKSISSATYLGERVAIIPAGVPGAGLWVRMMCAVRNFFSSPA